MQYASLRTLVGWRKARHGRLSFRVDLLHQSKRMLILCNVLLRPGCTCVQVLQPTRSGQHCRALPRRQPERLAARQLQVALSRCVGRPAVRISAHKPGEQVFRKEVTATTACRWPWWPAVVLRVIVRCERQHEVGSSSLLPTPRRHWWSTPTPSVSSS